MTLRARVAAGQILCSFSNIPHPSAAEILGRAGFDAVCLDAEHGTFGLEEISDGIRAIDLTGATPLVRVGEVNVLISQALDAGAAGVIVPRVSTGAEALAAVRFARYPPAGDRGLGYGRSTNYGTQMGDLSQANERTYLILQIETAAGVAAIDDIVSQPGIDMVLVGPFDLAASMSIENGSTAHREVISSVLARASSAGLSTGVFCASAADAGAYLESGVRLVILGSDVTMLSAQAAELVQLAAGMKLEGIAELMRQPDLQSARPTD